ncbi:MAG: hypothetical protein WAM67_00435 [Candidatus Acidiferrales bacterium]
MSAASDFVDEGEAHVVGLDDAELCIGQLDLNLHGGCSGLL